MTTEQLATIAGAAARCYSCRSLLAMRGATVRLADGIVPRPEKEPRTGLPRYGLPRRAGHGDPREAADRFANASSRSIGNPGAFYVNCPNCDRGQEVRFPPKPPYKAVRRA
jgi:hypothetical protein